MVSAKSAESETGAFAAGGDDCEFERLYEAAFPLVWAFAARGAATRDEAEAVATAILERAFTARRAGEVRGAWLNEVHAIARDEALARARG